ncbi:MAG: PEP-CTERM sorting domain-containing protein [Verrucomicrobia bacterium]|nr:PEP-CTERM sorting domain-containing protein [Verrucomicrobiota bacterium]MDA1005648.1 PEP-CTERM sorting domain-containing protein [Verrucomicrobiota bacterium]
MHNQHSNKRLNAFFALSLGVLAIAPASAVVTVGQIDDFQDGTTQGWTNTASMTNPPINQANTGPTGLGDNVLFSAVGGSPDTFSIVNSSQWAGDYVAAGITTITLDINNLGPNNLSLGILLNGGAAGTTSVSVPSGSGWVTRSIDLSTLLFGSPTNLSAVSSIELVSLQGGAVTSVGALDVYVDNIRAVPEPSTALLACVALTTAGLLRRRRNS